MEKSNKLILRLVPVLFVLVMIMISSNCIFAAVDVKDPSDIAGGVAPNADVQNVTSRVWQTVVVVVQIAAIAAIVIAGVRYMFASADTKADIKTQTVTLIVGAALVFAAVPIANFVQNVVRNIVGS